MLEHYFIIRYRESTGDWTFDTEEMTEVYPDGSVWDTDEQCYVSFQDMEPEEKNAARALSSRVRGMLANEKEGNNE